MAVPEGELRIWNGKRVGFHSRKCAAAWDKLTDAEKEAKLAPVTVGERANPRRMDATTQPVVLPGAPAGKPAAAD